MSRFWLSLSPACSRNPSTFDPESFLVWAVAIVPAGVIERPAHVLELVNQVQQAQPESFRF